MEASIVKRIKRIANQKKNEIFESQLFQSDEFRSFAKTTAESLMSDLKSRPQITLEHWPRCEDTGWTTGQQIFVNTANPISGHYSGLSEKFHCNMGILIHEVAHCLFTDFDKEKAAQQWINEGRMYPKMLENADEEFKTAFSEPCYRDIWGSIYGELVNRIADAHDEMCICGKYGDFVNKCIATVESALKARSTPIEKLIAEKGSNSLTIAYSLVLQYARFYDVAVIDQADFEKSRYGEMLNAIKDSVYRARYADKVDEKWSYINQILYALWPFFKEELSRNNSSSEQDADNSGRNTDSGDSTAQDNSSSGTQPSSQSQSGSGPDNCASSLPQTEEEKQRAAERLKEALEKGKKAAGTTSQAPVGRKTAKTAETSAKQAPKEGTNDQSPQLDAVLNQIAHNNAESQVEGEMSEELRNALNSLPKSPVNKNRPINIHRQLSYGDEDVAAYEESYGKVKIFSRALQKKLQKLLDELNDEEKHRSFFGTEIRASESYRLDKQFFFKKGTLADLPNMSIGVLIDCSGSMHGYTGEDTMTRLDVAKQTAVLLEDFANGLDIPIMVAGHNVQSGISMNVFVPFEKASNNDKYRIMTARCSGCNHDGVPLFAMAQLMAKREEEIKLLFLISDGTPNDGSYRGETAKEDLQYIACWMEKHGVVLFACGIGGDKDRLKAIYGDRFLDVQDLKTMPQKLVKICEKRMLQ